MVMANWYNPTISPRMDFGEHSDWYMGTRQLTAPTVSMDHVSLKRHFQTVNYLLTTHASNDTTDYEGRPVCVKLEADTQTEDNAS